MFSDKTFTPVSIPSNWKTTKSSEENGTQTSDLVGVDQMQQTTYTSNKQIQTNDIEPIPTATNVDEQALSSFLKRVCPKVLEELDKASKSKAFLSYAMPDEDSSQEVKSIHDLVKPKHQTENDLKVNSLAWSCTGGVVVLGLGSTAHDDWCSHTGYIHFYNINRSTSVNMVPTKILEATSCVTAVATHPFEPFILASGLYRGNILLWNLQQEGAECIATVNGHNDMVTQIAWITTSISRPQLVSSGLDGRMSIWNASHLSESLVLKESFVLNNDSDPSIEAGVTCFSFASSRPDVFVASLEGGKILYCSINATKLATKVGSDAPLKNPVIGELEGHKGLVTSISFSPYHEDLFLSVGTDHEIHVYSTLEVTPLKIIWCETEVLGLAWSPSQANIFFTWGSSAEVTIYDSKKGCKLTSLKTDENLMICALSFNWKSPKLLAIGDISGRAYVWQIPQYFKTG